MKVDIWIYDDYGGECHEENMTYGEALEYLIERRAQERFCFLLTTKFAEDFIKDVANESNEN